MGSKAGEAENALVLGFSLILWVFCENKNSSIFLLLFVSHINILRETEIKRETLNPMVPRQRQIISRLRACPGHV